MADQSQPLLAQISGNHRRVISVRLRALEESCRALMQLFRSEESILTLHEALPPAKGAQTQRLVAEFKARLSQMKTDLGLEKVRRDAAREAAALVAAMMVNIEELHPDHLKGYGKVPDGLAAYLQMQVEALLRVADAIEQTLRERTTGGVSGG